MKSYFTKLYIFCIAFENNKVRKDRAEYIRHAFSGEFSFTYFFELMKFSNKVDYQGHYFHVVVFLIVLFVLVQM